jgi:dolichol-phosphate mannosyltransferase
MKIAVVVPCYKVQDHILSVLEKIGDTVSNIYVVDDACPEGSGHLVQKYCKDPRISVIFNEKNMGVGGAVIRGYQAAILHNCDIIVKLDGDDQMDPKLIPIFTSAIERREADYTKGNRFFYLNQIKKMPKLRVFGNIALSIMTKFSSGYWDIFDPTNGYTAIHIHTVKRLPLEKISQRYFFESDMLFRLNSIRAVVMDIPMEAVYGREKSNLTIFRIVAEFLFKHFKNFLKRIFYTYYLRDVSAASLELPIGLFGLIFGFIFGGYHWYLSIKTGIVASTGTVLISAVPIIVGVNFIISFINHDMASVPKKSIHHFRNMN